MERSAWSKAEEEDQAALSEWFEADGAQASRKFASLGLLDNPVCNAGSALVALPSDEQVERFSWEPHLSENAGKVCAASLVAGQNNLNLALERQFEVRGQQLREGDCDALAPVVATPIPKPLPCRVAGRCVCKGDGLQLLRFRNKFYVAVKRRFKPNSTLRKAFVDGCVVMHLTSPSGDGCSLSRYLHMGLALLNPYRLSFQVLEEAADPGEAPPSDARQYLSALHDYRDDFGALDHLPLDRPWSVSFLLIEETVMTSAYLRPEVVPFMRLTGSEHFWKAPKIKKFSSKSLAVAVASIADEADDGADQHDDDVDELGALIDGDVDAPELSEMGGVEPIDEGEAEFDRLMEDAEELCDPDPEGP